MDYFTSTQPKSFLSILLLTMVCWSLSLDAMAYTVSGRVASATDDTPLAGTTVVLMTLPDSTFVAGTFSDAEGRFSINNSRIDALLKSRRAQQKLLVRFTFVGYQETVKVFTAHHKQTQFAMPDVYLHEDQRVLSEAVISAMPPPMVIREDTIEYFAASYKLEPDATAEDLLKRLPGMEVAMDGSITAQGETVKRVYVDGKEFFGNNMQATTKNLTADMMESVQVVDMKTEESRLTGIDNGEREKVINFKLKPKMRRGYFGNAAGAWGEGKAISDRFETRGMVGYFRGNNQNALVGSANNTNNAGFGDLGERTMRGSNMRGQRNSGQRGDGLNTSWSVGLNVNYDEGNRMRDQNTPLAVGGNALYGGSSQSEESTTHRVNFISSGNTGTDSHHTADNRTQNVQTDLKWEQAWGKIEEDGEHRIQVRPTLAFNSTHTDEQSASANYHLDPAQAQDDPMTSKPAGYINQTKSSNSIEQQGLDYGLEVSYSFAKKTERGRRRSSIGVSLNGRMNEGDHYTHSMTSYDAELVTDLALHADTVINQWQEEQTRNNSWRIRLSHVEPMSNNQFLELSAVANFSRNSQQQLYHFWDEASHQYRDSINGRSNLDYSSDAQTHQDSYTLTASYRKVTEHSNTSVGMELLPNSQRYTDHYDHSRDYNRHYINYAPRAEYRYNWDRHTNLRITLNGSTTQPSITQLQARKNQTSATHVTLGNKDLSPAYSTRFTSRFRTFSPETNRTLEASLSASASFNTLVSKRWYSPDLRTDTTQTVNLSGLGNWNVQGEFRGSFPFADNLWYVTTETSANYREAMGYANLKSTDSQVNHSKSTSVREQAGIAYRSETLNIELNGNYQWQHNDATVAGNLGTTHSFGVRTNLSWRLPYDWSLNTNLSYTGRRGFAATLRRNQTIWNAQVSRSFLKRKNLSAFVKVFDILHQKSSLSRSVSATSMTDRETTTLSQYFLVGCSIRFNQYGQRRGGQAGGREQGQREGRSQGQRGGRDHGR